MTTAVRVRFISTVFWLKIFYSTVFFLFVSLSNEKFPRSIHDNITPWMFVALELLLDETTLDLIVLLKIDQWNPSISSCCSARSHRRAFLAIVYFTLVQLSQSGFGVWVPERGAGCNIVDKSKLSKKNFCNNVTISMLEDLFFLEHFNKILNFS